MANTNTPALKPSPRKPNADLFKISIPSGSKGFAPAPSTATKFSKPMPKTGSK